MQLILNDKDIKDALLNYYNNMLGTTFDAVQTYYMPPKVILKHSSDLIVETPVFSEAIKND